ncbi:hypothetical protein L1267_22840 [Pseudoalteromonas sp. OFAV1]|jgi:hypothetical protein|uniref:hypothetical protein n=1 Tax=Pseudoalteromonas sp. OFAV1 TaxID=2908892 RepID=UPI001F325AC7|nr:hypothetical protein [Pseudoalteromonas sp. OFAV1]MCF2903209.1 hypothetical protein [Pseudoalteromonas sp. OFAV1]
MNNTSNHEFQTFEEQESYFNRIKKSLDLLIYVTKCTENGLIHSTRYDDYFGRVLVSVRNSLNALRYKYAYTHSVNNIPSELAVERDNSGYPSTLNFREIELDIQNEFANYKKNDDRDTLISKLVTVAMEEKRISKRLQSAISFSFYKQICLEHECFLLNNSPIINTNGDDSGHVELFVSHFDTSLKMPVCYIVEFHTNTEDKEESISRSNLVQEMLTKRISSELKLITIFSSLDDYFPWLRPIKMTRVVIGPNFISGVTNHRNEVEMLLDGGENSPAIACLTIEYLDVQNFSVDIGLFKNNKKTEYKLDRLRPDLCEAGVTNLLQKIILPYSSYQTLSECDDNFLSKYQKYVVDDDGEIMVF